MSNKPRRKPVARKKVEKKSEPLRLNLAVGQNPVRDQNGEKVSGWIGVDLHPGEHVDIVHNLLTFPWPFEDSSASHVWCSHFVEHIPHGDDDIDLWFLFFSELWRVMEPDGEATIIHPYCFNERAFQDPTHRRFIPVATWNYLNREWMKQNGLDHYGMPVGSFDWQATGFYAPGWDRRSEETKMFAQTHYIGVMTDLQVLLRCKKD